MPQKRSLKGIFSTEGVIFKMKDFYKGLGLGVAQWLRRCATCRTVPGSNPGGVTGFFSGAFPSDGTMTLGSTQPLVKMSTRNIPGGKGGRCVSLTTYHHTVPLSRNLGALTSQNSLGLFRPVTGQLYYK